MENVELVLVDSNTLLLFADRVTALSNSKEFTERAGIEILSHLILSHLILIAKPLISPAECAAY